MLLHAQSQECPWCMVPLHLQGTQARTQPGTQAQLPGSGDLPPPQPSNSHKGALMGFPSTASTGVAQTWRKGKTSSDPMTGQDTHYPWDMLAHMRLVVKGAEGVTRGARAGGMHYLCLLCFLVTLGLLFLAGLQDKKGPVQGLLIPWARAVPGAPDPCGTCVGPLGPTQHLRGTRGINSSCPLCALPVPSL